MLRDGYGIATYHFTNANSPHDCVTSIATVYPGSFTISDYLTTMTLVMGTTFSGNPPFKPSEMNSDYTWTTIDVLAQRAGLQYAKSGAGAGVGTVSADSPSINTSVKINKITGLAGKAYRGVMMVPPFLLAEDTEVDSGGVIDSSRVTGIETLFNNARVQMVNNGCTPVLLHSVITTPTVITSFGCGARVGTIRRRIKA